MVIFKKSLSGRTEVWPMFLVIQLDDDTPTLLLPLSHSVLKDADEVLEG